MTGLADRKPCAKNQLAITRRSAKIYETIFWRDLETQGCSLGLETFLPTSRSRLDLGDMWSRPRLELQIECLGLVSLSCLKVSFTSQIFSVFQCTHNTSSMPNFRFFGWKSTNVLPFFTYSHFWVTYLLPTMRPMMVSVPLP